LDIETGEKQRKKK